MCRRFFTVRQTFYESEKLQLIKAFSGDMGNHKYYNDREREIQNRSAKLYTFWKGLAIVYLETTRIEVLRALTNFMETFINFPSTENCDKISENIKPSIEKLTEFSNNLAQWKADHDREINSAEEDFVKIHNQCRKKISYTGSDWFKVTIWPFKL